MPVGGSSYPGSGRIRQIKLLLDSHATPEVEVLELQRGRAHLCASRRDRPCKGDHDESGQGTRCDYTLDVDLPSFRNVMGRFERVSPPPRSIVHFQASPPSSRFLECAPACGFRYRPAG